VSSNNCQREADIERRDLRDGERHLAAEIDKSDARFRQATSATIAGL